MSKAMGRTSLFLLTTPALELVADIESVDTDDRLGALADLTTATVV